MDKKTTEEIKESIRQQMQSEESIDFRMDLERLEREYKKETLEQGISSKKFPYAVLLIRSNSRQQVERGIKFLEEIRREKSDDDGRAALYYLALAQFRLGNYLEARQHIEALLQIEPKNRQANAMKALVNEQITKDGLVGIGLVGGATVLAAGAATAAFFLVRALINK
jgi:fission 1 protein